MCFGTFDIAMSNCLIKRRYHKNCFGIKRDITSSSSLGSRTDHSIGMSATASTPTSSTGISGKSDFSKYYPGKGMVRETLSTGDVMVKIPKFYYQRYRVNNIEYIKVSPVHLNNFVLHPCFLHNNKEQDYVYIGAYKTSSNNKSVSGATPQVNIGLKTMRTYAQNKGTGGSLIDLTTLNAIQMLYLVEFADNNSQSCIGSGVVDRGQLVNTGTCDNVPNLTGMALGSDTQVDIVYRGIEGLGGNCGEGVDGININGGKYYICNNQSQYQSETSTNYTLVSYAGSTNGDTSFIQEIGLDSNNSSVLLPQLAGNGSDNTYFTDATGGSTLSGRVMASGGFYYSSKKAGIFSAAFGYDPTSDGSNRGSRLLYIPN